MIPERWTRDALEAIDLRNAIVVNDVRDADGQVAIARGTRLTLADRDRLRVLPWELLHVVRMVSDDLGEMEAGTRLAAACAGSGVVTGDGSAGHWSLTAAHRGMVAVSADLVDKVNAIGGMAIYTLPDEQVVDRGETVARAKILPFLVPAADLHQAEQAARGGLVSVRAFARRRVAAVVQESLGSTALERFDRTLAEKVSWFGGGTAGVHVVAPEEEAIAGALARSRAAADLIVVAGTRAMDPLDPAFGAVTRAGGGLVRVGVPAHPGSLLWLARIGDVPVIGMPSCGLFSRATVFDLALSRLFAGLPVDDPWLAGLGRGGLLTRDAAWRFPPYRPRQDRGAVD